MKCPTCKKEIEYWGNPFRPFCSERCKLIDLGKWASGAYSLPGEEPVSSDDGDSGADAGGGAGNGRVEDEA